MASTATEPVPPRCRTHDMNDPQSKSSQHDAPIYPAYLPYRPDDDIDLFDVLETLWAGKVWIAIAMLTMLGVAGLYLQQRLAVDSDAPTPYRVIIPFTLNIDPYWRHAECAAGNGAINPTCVTEKVLAGVDADWRIVDNKTLEMDTTSPQAIDAYATYFATIAENTTKQAEATATADNAFINSDIPEALLGTEEIAQTALNAHRTLRQIGEGVSAIDFGPAEIVPAAAAAPPTKKILLAAAIAGILLGSLLVLVRAAYEKRKEERATA